MTNNDRRSYERIDVTLPCIIFLENQSMDFECKIINISERGICFEMDKEIADKIKIGATFKCLFCDENVMENFEQIYNIRVSVIRKNYIDSICQLGCIINMDIDTIKNYIFHKTAMRMINCCER